MALRNPETGIQYFSTKKNWFLNLPGVNPKNHIYHRVLRCRTELITHHLFIHSSSVNSLSWAGWLETAKNKDWDWIRAQNEGPGLDQGS